MDKPLRYTLTTDPAPDPDRTAWNHGIKLWRVCAFSEDPPKVDERGHWEATGWPGPCLVDECVADEFPLGLPPPGEKYDLLNLSAITPANLPEALAACVAAAGLPKVGTVVDRPRFTHVDDGAVWYISRYYIDGNGLTCLVESDMYPDHGGFRYTAEEAPRLVRPAAEAAALEVVEEGEV